MSYITFLSMFNVILGILFVVGINVFHTLPLFKYKCCPLKLIVALIHGWQLTQKAKLVAKKSNNAKKSEIMYEKG